MSCVLRVLCYMVYAVCGLLFEVYWVVYVVRHVLCCACRVISCTHVIIHNVRSIC